MQFVVQESGPLFLDTKENGRIHDPNPPWEGVFALLPNPPLFPNAPVFPVPFPKDELPKPVVAGFAPSKPPAVVPLDSKPPDGVDVDPNPPEDPKVEVAVLLCCG